MWGDFVKLTSEQKKEIKRELKLERCRKDFYYFCHTLAPRFYNNKHPHLRELCDTLQNFFEDPSQEVLVVNMPPRHGKSYTMQFFCDWVYIQQKEAHIMLGCYNEILSKKFSVTTRDTIDTKHSEDAEQILYCDIAKGIKLKDGNKEKRTWSIEGSYDSFLATSPSGTATGFGCSLLIIDDLIKSDYEAYNERILDEQYNWFTNTMLSRKEKGGKIIVIATRWSSGDLSGRVLDKFKNVQHYCKPALLNADTHEMLCPDLFDYNAYCDMIERAENKMIVQANYNQICLDDENRLYKNLQRYTTETDADGREWFVIRDEKELKSNLEVYSYCDTADQGTDYLCNIIFAFSFVSKKIYVLDVYYTQAAMEETEEETARRINHFKPITSRIESNNGGRGFARAVRRIVEEKYNNYVTNITYFTQHENKLARIRSNGPTVCRFCYFPADWDLIWPDFFRDINRFDSRGENRHDDCADALTGVVETVRNIGGI